MNILIVSFLKIKMKGLVFVNEVGIYLSFDLRMVYVSQLYVVKMFLNEFLGYEVLYVFNVTGNYFLDLNKTFRENQIAHGDILIYGR
jgi:predicted metallopeptidase